MPHIQDYKLILFDYDHTLTNSKREVTPRLHAALKRLETKGISLGLCTGRSFPILGKIALHLFSDHDTHVAAGGGQVISSTGKVYWEKLIPDQTGKKIVELAEEFDVGFLVPQEDRIYANQKMRDYLTYRKDMHDLKVFPHTDLTNYSTPVIPVFDAPLEFYNNLNELNDVNYKQMKTYGRSNADITAKGINKAIGIEQLCKVRNISPEEIIGIGDSENDDEFLAKVGFSVAMGNATEYLKSIANRTIGHMDEDGLAIYLENIVQGAQL